MKNAVRKHKQNGHCSEEEMNIYVDSVLDSLPVSDVKLMEIKEAQDEDPVCRQIKSYCLEGWPDKFCLNDALKPY